MRFCVANANAPPACPKRSHSPLDSESFRELITQPALLRSRPVIRLRVFLGTAFALAAILGAFVHAQSTDEQKKKKAREEMRAVTSPTPSETPEPTAKPKPATRKSKTKKKATPTPKPKAKPTETPEPTKSPRPKKQPPPPATTPGKKGKTEKKKDSGPPRPPPPVNGSWGPWSRQPPNYRYLTAANIDAIRRAPVQRARWKFIIVHNSGTRQGSARVFDYYHRHVRRMRNGLAYHFVIGNGTSTRNGQIETGDRWIKQMRGGHVHSDYMNNIGLGICLVGDFNRDQPTRAQLEACEELIKYLQERCGKMKVRPHREENQPRWATD